MMIVIATNLTKSRTSLDSPHAIPILFLCLLSEYKETAATTTTTSKEVITSIMDKLKEVLGNATTTAKEAIVGSQPDPDLRREALESAKQGKDNKQGDDDDDDDDDGGGGGDDGRFGGKMTFHQYIQWPLA